MAGIDLLGWDSQYGAMSARIVSGTLESVDMRRKMETLLSAAST